VRNSSLSILNTGQLASQENVLPRPLPLSLHLSDRLARHAQYWLARQVGGVPHREGRRARARGPSPLCRNPRSPDARHTRLPLLFLEAGGPGYWRTLAAPTAGADLR